MQLEMSDLVKIFNRMEALEERANALEARIVQLEQKKTPILDRPTFPTAEISGKYKGLAEYLYEKWDKKIELTYEQIEMALGFPLPPTAYNLPQSFWANTKTHSYASSWLAIGYKAKVNGEALKVVFERSLY